MGMGDYTIINDNYAIFGELLYWWRKRAYSVKTTNLPQEMYKCYYKHSSRVTPVTVVMKLTI
jgi:hypothetical protein